MFIFEYTCVPAGPGQLHAEAGKKLGSRNGMDGALNSTSSDVFLNRKQVKSKNEQSFSHVRTRER